MSEIAEYIAPQAALARVPCQAMERPPAGEGLLLHADGNHVCREFHLLPRGHSQGRWLALSQCVTHADDILLLQHPEPMWDRNAEETARVRCAACQASKELVIWL